jgi:putative addiction module killer protein
MQPNKREVRNLILGGKDHFTEWLEGLRDTVGRIAIRRRLDRVEDGNFGDRRFVGDGVWELRIHYGPGYRAYYGEDGQVIVLLLCGGGKRTQWQDILRAQKLWAEYQGTR